MRESNISATVYSRTNTMERLLRILACEWYLRRNYLRQIFCQSVQVFLSFNTPSFVILHRLSWPPLRQCNTSVLHCDNARVNGNYNA